MPASVASWFAPRREARDASVMALVVSDYRAAYRQRGESPARLALLFLPRMLANPELHATAMLRLALGGPRVLFLLWRTLLIALHSIDVMPDTDIGPGLRLPHPFGICIGWAAVIGADVTIYHNVTIGSRAHPRDLRAECHPPHVPKSEWRPCPTIEADVVIYTGSLVTGPITLGRGSVVGAQSWLDHDLAPGEVHRGSRG
jgi:serine O-acetyltransferase